MSGRIASCELKTGCNEQIEAIVRLPEEKRSVIFGTVLDSNRMPVADAVVKLLQIVDGCRYPYPLTHTFTDCHGQFLLGPLCPNTKYMLKIYKDNIVIRCAELETSSYNGKCIGKPDNGGHKSPKLFQDKTSSECDC
ncbi:carboxypeptidase regulatory-like domain-containing protein [Clostridium perfringens]|jgi:hypothetical protein|uniref:Carboxypeptidase regulatory-like domain-containing protein n=1 Tax=Clostridium perfringens TaxID=1502 RepID=A0AAW9IH21_CLOPF|nr:carboxypeptidase regulatory-like domain-containing protein [Clostridium perfringens]MDZ5000886.1 carboxypeptidase regulatory-like domain-containing protein [Clostridium perfringens]